MKSSRLSPRIRPRTFSARQLKKPPACDACSCRRDSPGWLPSALSRHHTSQRQQRAFSRRHRPTCPSPPPNGAGPLPNLSLKSRQQATSDPEMPSAEHLRAVRPGFRQLKPALPASIPRSYPGALQQPPQLVAQQHQRARPIEANLRGRLS